MVDSEPVSINEALKKKVWLKDMTEELEAIDRNKTWELTVFVTPYFPKRILVIKSEIFHIFSFT